MKLHSMIPFLYPSLLSYSHGCIPSSKFIINRNLPSCKNCVHFSPYHEFDFGSSLSHCQKFGTKNIVSDKIHYEYADNCRRDESKCGKEGRYFEPEPNLSWKIGKHYTIANWRILLASIYIFGTLYFVSLLI